MIHASNGEMTPYTIMDSVWCMIFGKQLTEIRHCAFVGKLILTFPMELVMSTDRRQEAS